MPKHFPFSLVLIVLLVFALSACEMKASTPPPTTPTVDLSTMQAEATLTAIAKSQSDGDGSGDVVGGKTLTPVVTDGVAAPTSTNTPLPTATLDSTAVPVPTYGVPSSYTLRKGEFPFCLARRFNINQETLLAYNGLSIYSRLPSGYTLQIPPNAGPFVGNRELLSHPTTYNVKAGDTFYSIACDFGDVDPRAIAAVNGMDVSQSLSAGMVIEIP